MSFVKGLLMRADVLATLKNVSWFTSRRKNSLIQSNSDHGEIAGGAERRRVARDQPRIIKAANASALPRCSPNDAIAVNANNTWIYC